MPCARVRLASTYARFVSEDTFFVSEDTIHKRPITLLVSRTRVRLDVPVDTLFWQQAVMLPKRLKHWILNQHSRMGDSIHPGDLSFPSP